MTKLVLVLVLSVLAVGCADTPPPYDMSFGDGISEYEQQQWRTAGAAWNGVVGRPVLVDRVPGECGHIRIIRGHSARGETFHDAERCNIVIRFRDEGDKLMRLHELGHALLSGTDDDHRDDSVMSAHADKIALELTPEDGAAVRDHWALDVPAGH